MADIVGLAFAPSFYPGWYFLFVAMGYALLLPAIAVLHVRHQTLRESGAVLATSAGTVTVAVGIAAGANFDLVVAALVVRGMWWWTIGKMWSQTGLMPRWLGLPTMFLSMIVIAVPLASAPFGLSSTQLWIWDRLLLGLWSLALSYGLWLTRGRATRPPADEPRSGR